MEQTKVPGEGLSCVRCNVPLRRVRFETWAPSNILLKQLQKIADSTGLYIYHCPRCRKIEFFK